MDEVRALIARWEERSASFAFQVGNPAKAELDDCIKELKALAQPVPAEASQPAPSGASPDFTKPHIETPACAEKMCALHGWASAGEPAAHEQMRERFDKWMDDTDRAGRSGYDFHLLWAAWQACEKSLSSARATAAPASREIAFLEEVLSHLNGECGTPQDEELWAAKEMLNQRLATLRSCGHVAASGGPLHHPASGVERNQRPEVCSECGGDITKGEHSRLRGCWPQAAPASTPILTSVEQLAREELIEAGNALAAPPATERGVREALELARDELREMMLAQKSNNPPRNPEITKKAYEAINTALAAAAQPTDKESAVPPNCKCGHSYYSHLTETTNACMVGTCSCEYYERQPCECDAGDA